VAVAKARRTARATPQRKGAAYEKVNERDCTVSTPNVYQGKKTLQIGYYFRRKACSRPVMLLTYSIPPGGSEGMHTHRVGDKLTGSYDEFYYVIAGTGCMHIDGDTVRVEAGDYVHVPNGVAHDLENTSRRRTLKVHLLAIER
jgi:mannose-6-phosphate isomerase-like protein (cupin superfamily)